ncbi:MAG: hypothetical protein IT581_09955 [Verrucomicrobiales bacterium]|nr:hypothetical protein [Verrucomicrobiales bacterium]
MRPSRKALDPRQPGGWLVENERAVDGRLIGSLTAFLTNRECPWRCVFCDLWQFALDREVKPGDVPDQLRAVLEQHARSGGVASQIKLFNAGSFFDSRAIPASDDPVMADLVGGFERVVVESHPALVGSRCWRFRDGLLKASGGRARLEVAMGLETANPEVLARLNKRVTLSGFRQAASALRREGVDLRVFVLVRPPFEDPTAAGEWVAKSVACAFEAGATVVSLIPVRSGNGALEALRAQGLFHPPSFDDLESALDSALALGGGRVFADLWDLERFRSCGDCFAARRARLERMNLTQCAEPRVRCDACGAGEAVR